MTDSNINLDPQAVLAEVQNINPLVFELAMERCARKAMAAEVAEVRQALDALAALTEEKGKDDGEEQGPSDRGEEGGRGEGDDLQE